MIFVRAKKAQQTTEIQAMTLTMLVIASYWDTVIKGSGQLKKHRPFS